MARQIALDAVLRGDVRDAIVWLAWRPGDVEPRWTEILATPKVAPVKELAAPSLTLAGQPMA